MNNRKTEETTLVRIVYNSNLYIDKESWTRRSLMHLAFLASVSKFHGLSLKRDFIVDLAGWLGLQFSLCSQYQPESAAR